MQILLSLAWAPQLLARLVTGILFFISGWGKIQDLDKFRAELVGWKIPAPRLTAPFVAWSEFVFGALLIVGLFCRLASFAMLINMGMALFTVQIKKVHTLGDFVYLPEVSLIALLFWLTVEGGGRVSIDFLL